MEALIAIMTILAIVAVVVVVGGLIAFIGHMVIGAFDTNKGDSRTNAKQMMDYSQYKQNENSQEVSYNAEYDFESISRSKAEKEKKLLEKESFDIYAMDDDKDEELEEIENRLKFSKEEADVKEPEIVKEEKVVEAVEEKPVVVAAEPSAEAEQEDNDLDLDDLLNEISDEVIEEEKAEANTEIKMSDELNTYNIDEMLRKAEEELDKIEEDFDEDVANDDVVDEDVNIDLEDDELIDDVVDEDEEEEEITPKKEERKQPALLNNATVHDDSQQALTKPVSQEMMVSKEVLREEQKILENKIGNVLKRIEHVAEKKAENRLLLLNDTDPEIQRLKAELAELKRQLEIARETKVEVIAFDMTEEECVKKLEILEERLRIVKKDYKINLKEYKPLKKVMNDLERYQTKLRRKEAVVAKKKVALYGVNNYVDIDKEKAEKLANELELLDGLRLSVSHCEEVINSNKDRFPILEHSNQILENQIAHLEADIAETQRILRKIRERNGTGNNDNNEGTVE